MDRRIRNAVHVLKPCALALVAFAMMPSTAAAHTGRDNIASSLWGVLLAAVLFGGAALAYRGFQAAAHRRRAHRDAALFAAGWLTIVAALLSPIDVYGEVAFSVHMLQHVLLMNLGVPLLLLAKPAHYVPAGAPRAARAWSATRIRPPLRRLWLRATAVSSGFIINAVVIWIWHYPPIHDWALVTPSAHVLQHLSFTGGAVVFWAAIWRAAGRARAGLAILSLFATAIHTGILGAFLTFSARTWYGGYTPSDIGLDPLADQQLAGAIMWIPGGFSYTIAAVVMMQTWLRLSDAGLKRI